MKKIILYSHGGSKNHGCEAIVRATHKILNKENIELYSLNKNEDEFYGIDKLMNIKDAKCNIKRYNYKNIIASLKIRFFDDASYSEKNPYTCMLKRHKTETLSISVGGDNYCYSDNKIYGLLNSGFNKNGVKTVLWGCSVEPSLIDERMAKDLSLYSLITARESISYEALKKVNHNTKLYPDPAFQLGKIEMPLPEGFEENNTIGINLSPLIIKCESSKGVTMKNYQLLIDHIIQTTNMNIALIPHVVWEHNDDREPLKELFDKFKSTNRVIMISDYNCLEIKGYIARCRMFIGARTHATIAAYSTCVPTLVVGYSVKATGIAKDIFGTHENYVIPVQYLENKDDLINAFKWMEINEERIKIHLEKFMPNYCKRALEANKEIEKLLVSSI